MLELEIVNLLNQDLKREWTHFKFYLLSSILVSGPHRQEFSEFLKDAATGEMEHIFSFGNLINHFTDNIESSSFYFPTDLTELKDILQYALGLETEVLEHYANRMEQLKDANMSDVNKRWIEAFLEDKIIDSRTDADNIRKMLIGM